MLGSQVTTGRLHKAILLDWKRMPPEAMVDLHSQDRVAEVVRQTILKQTFDVFTLAASNRDEVFEILNIRHPPGYKNRSLSVGDLVVTPDKKVFVCASFGWIEAPADVQKELLL